MSGGSAPTPGLDPGTPVGEYVVRRQIGQGGMGLVYAGEQPLIGKQVAIKVLSSELAEDQNQIQRLLGEARAVNLIHHPNIIDIFAFGVLPDGRPYFVMEYLEGDSLETALRKNAVSPADLTILVEQLCQALGAAHDAGFVHRDLKPDNLWLLRKPDHTPFLKILDFGIAKNIRIPAPGLTVTGQVLGTAQYMAPEQVLARTVDARTDIYAIGIILYRILAGELPFDDPNLYTVVTKQVTEEPRPLSAHRKLPADLERVVMRCLAKEPADRPQTDAELWREIGPALRAWQAAKTGEGLAATRWAPIQTSTMTDQARRESAVDHKANSQSTIQPVGRTYQKTRTVSRNGKRVLGACIVVTMAMAGGIVLYASLPGTHPQSPRLSAALRPPAYDGAPLTVPVSTGLPPPLPLGAVQGERDGGAGGPASGQTHPPTLHPARKASRENDNPVRL